MVSIIHCLKYLDLYMNQNYFSSIFRYFAKGQAVNHTPILSYILGGKSSGTTSLEWSNALTFLTINESWSPFPTTHSSEQHISFFSCAISIHSSAVCSFCRLLHSSYQTSHSSGFTFFRRSVFRRVKNSSALFLLNFSIQASWLTISGQSWSHLMAYSFTLSYFTYLSMKTP